MVDFHAFDGRLTLGSPRAAVRRHRQHWGTIPLGAISGGFLGEVIGLHDTIWVATIGSLVAFVPVALSPVRKIREMPEPVGDDIPLGTYPTSA